MTERGHLPRVGHCSIHVVLPSETWIAVFGSTQAPLPTTSTWRGRLHCFKILLLALGSILATFSTTNNSRPFGLALRLSFSCHFRCGQEILAALETGTCALSRALVSFYTFPPRFSCGIIASLFCVSDAWIPHCFD